MKLLSLVCLVLFLPALVTSVNTVELVVEMTDTGGDGWNGFSFGIQQLSKIVSTFGENFKSGSSLDPISLFINKDTLSQIVVYSKGLYSQQIGFKVSYKNGQVIVDRQPGLGFTSLSVFKSFCPSSSCNYGGFVTLNMTLLDSYGDGWSTTQLLFITQGKNYTIPDQSSKFSENTIQLSLPRNVPISLLAIKADDEWSDEIGYSLRTSQGSLIISRVPGIKFATGETLSFLCIDCQKVYNIGLSTSCTDSQPAFTNVYLITMCVLAGVAIFLLVIFVFLVVRLVKKIKKSNYRQTKQEVKNSQVNTPQFGSSKSINAVVTL